MPIKKELTQGKFPIKIWTNDIEQSAEKQLHNISQMPFIHKHVAVMPDVHWGMGATIGSVIPTKGAIIPAAVGVDLGCGMMAVETNLTANDLPDSLKDIRHKLEARIPHGRTISGNGRSYDPKNDRGLWNNTPLSNIVDLQNPQKGSNYSMELRLKAIVEKQEYKPLTNQYKRYHNQLGTLGTGNHFVEICLDKEDNVWVMLHSGSRGIGNTIGSYFIEKAKQDMRKWFINLPDKDLAYFVEGTDNFNDYVEAVQWAQEFAALNRESMMSAALIGLKEFFPQLLRKREAINCHHNYISRENHFNKNVWITRKGAIRARKDDLGIIPGSMGARSFIVKGLGNNESFCSCSHGAGRTMSRASAKKAFTIEDLKNQTAGVECRKDKDVIDEIPGAYKDIEQVMDNQDDLVEVVAELKQILCIKG